MKVLLYFENEDSIKKSGIGRALKHQLQACKDAGVETTTDKNSSFDIAHINTLWNKSERLLKKCKKKGIPVIVHGHSTYEDFRRSFSCWQLIEPWFDGRIRKMYSKADLIITPTTYSKGLIDGYGFGVKTIAISNGINIPEYLPNPEGQKKFKEKFGIEDGEKFVMGVGFPFERKGILDFFEVAKSFPDTKFIWFGHLAKILTNLKIRRAIRKRPANVIMAGYCSGDIIHGAYDLASCMFFPSLEETEGIVVLEALASHTPLLVRDIGVYEPWLSDGVNCHKAKTNEEFEKTLRHLLEEGEDPNILEEGYKVALERSLDKVGEQLKEAYLGLLKRE